MKGAKKMCKLRMILVLVALGALCVPPILATDLETKPSSHQSNHDQNAAEKMVQQIEQSHIDGNVPAAKDFHKFLVRDLQKYFSSLLKTKVLVEYELLRDGPTQSGVSFPKYYAWVKIYGKGAKLIEQGAVRVAAEDKTEFGVTDFWNVNKIRDDEKNLPLTFPKNLCALVSAKASGAAN